MRQALNIILLFLAHLPCHSQSAPPIGQWREHLPYNRANSLELIENTLWTATPYSLFSLNPADNSVERFSRVNGLTETGIRTIGRDASGLRLVVVYNSGNIDILHGADISNIPDLARSTLIRDKTVNQVYSNASNTWLAGNEAIYELNIEKNEIRDTYVIGSAGFKVKISSIAAFRNNLYAATTEGLRFAALSATNLSDFRAWRSDTATGLPTGPVDELLSVNNQLFCRVADSVFISTGSNWNFLYRDGWKLNSLRAAGDRIAIHE
ncbi:MAG: hypothetical protein EOO94_02905, partial [Pedobacter sp.]